MSDIKGYGIKLNKEYKPYSKVSFDAFSKTCGILSAKAIKESYEKTISTVVKYVIAVGTEELHSQLEKYAEYDPIIINRALISEEEYSDNLKAIDFEFKLYVDSEILDKMVQAARDIKNETIYTEPIDGKFEKDKFEDILNTIIKVANNRNNYE